MINKKSKIIFVKPSNSSFINLDEIIFNKYFEVIPCLIKLKKDKIKIFIGAISLLFFLFFKTRKSKLFITWFADYHAAIMVFIAKFFGKKSIVFIGGQEAICYPELKKGVYLKKTRSAFVKYALKNTNLIIANHSSLIYHENSFYNQEKPHIDGVKHYIPDLKTPIKIVYNGINPDRIKRDYNIRKSENIVLTVGTMFQINDFYNKGFDLFIDVARRNKNITFVLISIKEQYRNWLEENYKVSEILNLKIIPYFCPDETLMYYYNIAKVYVQVSITEGMPVSLNEAMLCECIPVGSNVNGIPDAIGNTGIVICERNVNELEKAILEALQMNSGDLSRKFVLDNFNIEKREEEILKITDDILK
ncbi:MAG TPA: glycosyltransferase family 4 protein [Bacteroidales bacterium]|nr:glycosyltransferase family 4 protein [Bacteroidales bacterium]HPS18173.1 glycosyltransferase family 4 protein [Bacteroidales bacterium]